MMQMIAIIIEEIERERDIYLEMNQTKHSIHQNQDYGGTRRAHFRVHV